MSEMKGPFNCMNHMMERALEIALKAHAGQEDKAGVPYPEVYEVLDGKAFYLLQSRDLTDVIVLAAKKGDVILIPPGYGHVTINPGKTDLVMANLVSPEFSSEYGEIAKNHGAAYYYMEKEGWVANPEYGKTIPLHMLIPSAIPELGLKEGRTLYDMVGSSDTLDFLNHPENYAKEFKKFFTE